MVPAFSPSAWPSISQHSPAPAATRASSGEVRRRGATIVATLSLASKVPRDEGMSSDYGIWYVWRVLLKPFPPATSICAGCHAPLASRPSHGFVCPTLFSS
eukprot:scaffold2376_cov115-Isochrysis_galbana.AAC.2